MSFPCALSNGTNLSLVSMDHLSSDQSVWRPRFMGADSRTVSFLQTHLSHCHPYFLSNQPDGWHNRRNQITEILYLYQDLFLCFNRAGLNLSEIYIIRCQWSAFSIDNQLIAIDANFRRLRNILRGDNKIPASRLPYFWVWKRGERRVEKESYNWLR